MIYCSSFLLCHFRTGFVPSSIDLSLIRISSKSRHSTPISSQEFTWTGLSRFPAPICIVAIRSMFKGFMILWYSHTIRRAPVVGKRISVNAMAMSLTELSHLGMRLESFVVEKKLSRSSIRKIKVFATGKCRTSGQ